MNKYFLLVSIFCITLSYLSGETKEMELTFAQAGELAVSASRDFHGEKSLLSIKEEAWALGRRAYFPKVTLSAYEDDRLSKTSSDSYMKNYNVGLEQLVFDGGRLMSSRKIEKAKLSFEASQLERKAIDIADAAISAYRQVLSSREMIQIQEAGLFNLQEQRRIMAKEVELGITLPADLSEADISIRESKIEILTLKMELNEMEKQFCEMIGVDEMPLLTEKIDINYHIDLLPIKIAHDIAQSQNRELISAQLSINEKQEAAKLASLSWIPSLSATGNFTVSGQSYPLTKYSWSFGLIVEFSSPWLSGGSAFATGMEGAHSQTMRLQGSVKPVPDPVSSMTPRQAKVALSIEQTKFHLIYDRMGRIAETLVEKCSVANQKKTLSLESRDLAEQRLTLSKLKHELGQLTSIDFMKVQIELTKKNIELIQSVAAQLAAERELEKLLDLKPGELKKITSSNNINKGANYEMQN
ncbi:hypothetical protein FACS189494_08360 [Spirochaetia bacterium]|nr:hypothetical protein FACS189494_08360 [Spirochaetia bacterium]